MTWSRRVVPCPGANAVCAAAHRRGYCFPTCCNTESCAEVTPTEVR